MLFFPIFLYQIFGDFYKKIAELLEFAAEKTFQKFPNFLVRKTTKFVRKKTSR
jgi:hypothetical protein